MFAFRLILELFIGLGFFLAIGVLATAKRRSQIGYLVPLLNIIPLAIIQFMGFYLTYFTTHLMGIRGSGVGLVGGYGAASKFIDRTYPYNFVQTICWCVSAIATLYLIIKLQKPLNSESNK